MELIIIVLGRAPFVTQLIRPVVESLWSLPWVTHSPQSPQTQLSVRPSGDPAVAWRGRNLWTHIRWPFARPRTDRGAMIPQRDINANPHRSLRRRRRCYHRPRSVCKLRKLSDCFLVQSFADGRTVFAGDVSMRHQGRYLLIYPLGTCQECGESQQAG